VQENSSVAQTPTNGNEDEASRAFGFLTFNPTGEFKVERRLPVEDGRGVRIKGFLGVVKASRDYEEQIRSEWGGGQYYVSGYGPGGKLGGGIVEIPGPPRDPEEEAGLPDGQDSTPGGWPSPRPGWGPGWGPPGWGAPGWGAPGWGQRQEAPPPAAWGWGTSGTQQAAGPEVARLERDLAEARARLERTTSERDDLREKLSEARAAMKSQEERYERKLDAEKAERRIADLRAEFSSSSKTPDFLDFMKLSRAESAERAKVERAQVEASEARFATLLKGLVEGDGGRDKTIEQFLALQKLSPKTDPLDQVGSLLGLLTQLREVASPSPEPESVLGAVVKLAPHLGQLVGVGAGAPAAPVPAPVAPAAPAPPAQIAEQAQAIPPELEGLLKILDRAGALYSKGSDPRASGIAIRGFAEGVGYPPEKVSEFAGSDVARIEADLRSVEASGLLPEEALRRIRAFLGGVLASDQGRAWLAAALAAM